MTTFDELKNIVFEEANYFGACTNDLFFSEEEKDEYGIKLEGLCDLMRKLGWDQEWMES